MRHCKRFVKGFGKTRSIGADWAQVNKFFGRKCHGKSQRPGRPNMTLFLERGFGNSKQ